MVDAVVGVEEDVVVDAVDTTGTEVGAAVAEEDTTMKGMAATEVAVAVVDMTTVMGAGVTTGATITVVLVIVGAEAVVDTTILAVDRTRATEHPCHKCLPPGDLLLL